MTTGPLAPPPSETPRPSGADRVAQPTFLIRGTAGPKVEVRRHRGLIPVVTLDGTPVKPRWSGRALLPLGLGATVVGLDLLAGIDTGTIAILAAVFVGSSVVIDLPWRGEYALPMYDGTTKTLTLKGVRRGIVAYVDGHSYPVEDPLPTIDLSLSVLPFIALLLAILVPVAPFRGPSLVGSFSVAVAGILGLAAFAGAQLLARARLPRATRLIGMGALTLALVAVQLGVHYGHPSFPASALGNCLDIGFDGSLTARTVPVSCSAPHESEIIGTPDLPGDAYPGQTQVVALTIDACTVLFTPYVGSDPGASSLALDAFMPSQSLWDSGARTATCVVYRKDHSPLGQSVKGSHF